jgi:hypothetical protein
MVEVEGSFKVPREDGWEEAGIYSGEGVSLRDCVLDKRERFRDLLGRTSS